MRNVASATYGMLGNVTHLQLTVSMREPKLTVESGAPILRKDMQDVTLESESLSKDQTSHGLGAAWRPGSANKWPMSPK